MRQCPRAKKCAKLRCTSTLSVLIHGAERVHLIRTSGKTDHASPNTGQTRTNAGPDKANTNAERKTFSKSKPNASSNHADTNPAPLDLGCAIPNDHSSIIT